MPRDIDGLVDEIDRLVDESLAGYGERSGYDYNLAEPICPHCGRDWHGIELTVEIARMYGTGIYDDSYRADQDDSPIVCRGSDFIGPMPVEPGWRGLPPYRYREHFARVRLFTAEGRLIAEFDAISGEPGTVTVELDVPPGNYDLPGGGVVVSGTGATIAVTSTLGSL